MASSFVEFKGSGFWANDFYLEVWVYYFVKEIEKINSPIPVWLQELKQDWLKMATVGMLGSINLSLDSYVTDEERKKVLLDIAKKTNHSFFNNGDVLPLEIANKPFKPTKYFTEPPETSTVLKVGKFFIKLLRGKLTYKASGPFEYLKHENWRKL